MLARTGMAASSPLPVTESQWMGARIWDWPLVHGAGFPGDLVCWLSLLVEGFGGFWSQHMSVELPLLPTKCIKPLANPCHVTNVVLAVTSG